MQLRVSWTKVRSALENFTLSFLCGLTVLVLSVWGNHHHLFAEHERFSKILITIGVFVPLMVSSEWLWIMKWNTKLRVTWSVLTLILAAIYYVFRLPDMQHVINEEWYAIQIAIHALITRWSLLRIVPAYMKRDAKNTRAHAYKFILDIITTGIFCGVLFGGLAAALGAVDFLFGINVASERYGDLAIIIFSGFGTLFALSHLSVTPTVYTYTQETFPKVLRVFAEYILGFLLLIYAGILFAYSFKIVASGQWPHGVVAWLIFGFVGMWMVYSAILLPRTIDSLNMRLRSRVLWLCFAAFAVLLRAALQQRVMDYGRTVQRCLIVLIAIRIVLLAVSLLLARPSLKRRIISWSVLAIVGIYGPVNVFSVAENDQTARLDKALNDMRTNSTAPADSLPHNELENQISNIVLYLLTYHGKASLSDFTDPETLYWSGTYIDSANNVVPTNPNDAYSVAERVVISWWLRYEPYGRYSSNWTDESMRYVYFNAPLPGYLVLDGYTSLSYVEWYADNSAYDKPMPVNWTMEYTGNVSLPYSIDYTNMTLTLLRNGTVIPLSSAIEEAGTRGNDLKPLPMTQDPILLTGDTYAFYITSLNWTYTKTANGETPSLTSLNGLLLIR